MTVTAHAIAETLADLMPRHWDGRACVEELKRANYHWRQMEWIGFWFQFRALQVLAELGASVGPTIGSVTFDCALDGVWDFKAHPLKCGAGYAYLNDEEAVDTALREYGHVGWLIAVGKADYDGTGSFKRWHDILKGKESAYVRKGNAIGRTSRRRKVAFDLTEIVWIEFRSTHELDSALHAEVLRRGLQMGQQNSDGSARRAKYGFSHGRWRRYVDNKCTAISTGSIALR